MALVCCLCLNDFTQNLKITVLKMRVYVNQQDLAVFLCLVFQNCRCQFTKRKAQLLYIHHLSPSRSGRGGKERQRKITQNILTKFKESHMHEEANCPLFLPYSFLIQIVNYLRKGPSCLHYTAVGTREHPKQHQRLQRRTGEQERPGGTDEGRSPLRARHSRWNAGESGTRQHPLTCPSH